MGTVQGLTKDRMLAIEAASIVGGSIDPVTGHLILEQFDGTLIDAGPVAGKNVMGVDDTDTLNLSITGNGTAGAPWEITGEVLGVKTYEVLDWNNAITPGTYWSTNAVNSPESSAVNWFVGRVYTYPPSGRIIQELRHVNTDGHRNVYTRYWNGTAWTAWGLDGGVGEGPTASRDIIFPPPTTDAQRAALANRRVRWYNTDLGWEESYYAVTGTAGLTARGLVSGVSSGWYPTGEGPYVTLEPTTTFSASTGNYVGNWHNGNMKRKGGAACFVPSSNGFTEVLLAGRYDITVWTLLTSGTGTANFHLRVLNNALSVIEKQIDGLAFTLTASFAVRMHVEYENAIVKAGEKVGLFCHNGSLTVHALTFDPRAQFHIRYKGPALVSD